MNRANKKPTKPQRVPAKPQRIQAKVKPKVKAPPPANVKVRQITGAVERQSAPDRTPPWPFARRSETISIDEWPKIYKKIKDKALKETEHELDAAHVTIKELLDERDRLKEDLASAQYKLDSVKNALN